MIIVELAGHLGADPETRVTPSGLKVTTLRIAANIYQSGKEETVWWRVTLWGTEFDKILQYTKKGSAVFIIGEMSKPEIYNDREGRPQISLNVTARMLKLSPFGKSNNQEGGSPQAYATPMPNGKNSDEKYQTQNLYGAAVSQSYDESLDEKEEHVPF